jgi:hypothetical protein
VSAELVELTATEAAGKIARGELSSAEYTGALIAQVEKLEDKVQAFQHFDAEHALEQAKERDAYRANGNAQAFSTAFLSASRIASTPPTFRRRTALRCLLAAARIATPRSSRSCARRAP